MEPKRYIEGQIPRLEKRITGEAIASIARDMYTDYVENKADLSEEFFLITNTHVCRVDTREERPKVEYYEISHVGYSLYDLAAFIANGDQPQRIIPANSEVEKRIRDSFGALGIEGHLSESSVTFAVEHLPTRAEPSDVVVLDYNPPQKK